MPFIRIDALDGRNPSQISQLLDAVHRAVVSAFQVPERDRYQLYHAHPATHLVIQDTGLGIKRSEQAIVVSVLSRPRPEEQKCAFYARLVDELATCGMQSSDIVVSITSNSDADWSFGYGRAQFLTGEL
jgi:phenylpyruvate tautomerase PptA (4-oxalocrotonate tautomerase family)